MINKTFPIAEKLISNGLSLSRTLFKALQDESQLLINQDKDKKLDAITQHKQHLISEISQFTQQIGQVLQTEQLNADKIGLASYFERAKAASLDTQKAEQDWQELITLSEKARDLNNQNGAGIELLLRHTRLSLNILKGKPQSVHTYGRDGSTQADAGSNTFYTA
jgi:flagellar biosynthesis protein FlgN